MDWDDCKDAAEFTFGRFSFRSCMLGFLTALGMGIYFDSIRTSVENDDLVKNGKGIEVLATDSAGIQHKDTMLVIPLNISKEFRFTAYPLIKEGKLKVVKGNAPKLLPR